MTDDIGRSLFTDYLGLQDELTEQELDYLERTRRFVDHEVLPVIGDYWQRAEFPFELMRKQNLSFKSYAMPAGNNTNAKYDARVMGPNRQASWGIRLPLAPASPVP